MCTYYIGICVAIQVVSMDHIGDKVGFAQLHEFVIAKLWLILKLEDLWMMDWRECTRMTIWTSVTSYIFYLKCILSDILVFLQAIEQERRDKKVQDEIREKQRKVEEARLAAEDAAKVKRLY